MGVLVASISCFTAPDTLGLACDDDDACNEGQICQGEICELAGNSSETGDGDSGDGDSGDGDPNSCIDPGTEMPRAIDPPTAGELVISEFMANPDAVTDSSGEWFEIHALAPFDLNGLELRNTASEGQRSVVSSPTCLELASGDYAVFARETNPSINGGLVAVTHTFGFELSDADGELFVAFDGMSLDEIGWSTSEVGSSTALDPDQLSPDTNDLADDGATWCYATTPYGDGDQGSPGTDNPQCG